MGGLADETARRLPVEVAAARAQGIAAATEAFRRARLVPAVVPLAGPLYCTLGDMVTLRLASRDDLAWLPGIERAAGEAFRSLGMDAVADDEPPTLEELGEYQQGGRVIVGDVDGRVVAYLLLDVIAGAAHIEQVSLHPDVARRRIGRQLIEAAERWAREQGLSSLTLTCYRHVPWNGPYYARLGFRVVPDNEQPPELRAVRQAETDRGLDAWPRVAMRRPVSSGSSPAAAPGS